MHNTNVKVHSEKKKKIRSPLAEERILQRLK